MNFYQFLTEATIFSAAVNNTVFAIYSAKKARFPRTVVIPVAPATELKQSERFELIELPVLKFDLPPGATRLSIPELSELPFYKFPRLFTEFMRNPVERREAFINYAQMEHKVKLSFISRKQLAAFFIKKEISLEGMKKYFGDLSFDVSDVSVKDIADNPISVKASKDKKSIVSKNENKGLPTYIGPFTIVYPGRYKESESLAKLVKVITVYLRKKGIEELFKSAIINFETGLAKGRRGVALGNVVKVSASLGYSSYTLSTIAHEIWHWLEDKHPEIVTAMHNLRSTLLKNASELGNVSYRLESLIDPDMLIGKRIVLNTKDFTDAHATIKSWSSYQQTFTIQLDTESQVQQRPRGKSVRYHPLLKVPTDVIVKSGNVKFEDGTRLDNLIRSTWHVSQYASTNAREFGAELFTIWLTGRLSGQPEKFMTNFMNAAKSKYL